jgi:hypothetical protein
MSTWRFSQGVRQCGAARYHHGGQHQGATIGKVTIADTGRFLRYDGGTEPW